MSQPNPLPTPTEQLGYHDAHGDAERGDRIDHFPGALKEAEEAAQRGGMKGLTAEQSQAASGTVNLLHRYGDTDKDNIVLIPAPTADPQDPLNLPFWRRILTVVLLQMFASFGQAAVSAFASLEPFLKDEYESAGKGSQDILNLSVMPVLTQGLANLGLAHLALGFGRRPIYIFANILLLLAIFLAANNHSFEEHLAYRLMMGLAVGLGQSLVPLMTKEIFFLSSRGRILACSSGFNSFLALVWGCFVPNVVNSIGWRNLYYVEAAVCSFAFAIGIFLMPETSYVRPLEAYNGLGYGKNLESNGSSTPSEEYEKSKGEQDMRSDVGEKKLIQITELTRADIDNANYMPRTWLTDLRPFQRKFQPKLSLNTFLHALQMLFFPNILILCATNGFFLTVNIVHSATYARVVLAPPHNWPRSSIGYVQLGGLIDMVLTPIMLGFLSDRLIKYFAKKRKGVHEVETRLLVIFAPGALGMIAMAMHGVMLQNPGSMHWFAQPIIYGLTSLAFSGTHTVAYIYALEAYPTRGASAIIIINTVRACIAFAWMSDFMGLQAKMRGPLKAWCGFAGIAGGLLLLAGLLFFIGKRIRLFTLRYVVDTDKDGNVVSADT